MTESGNLRIAGAEVLCPAGGLSGIRDLWVRDGLLCLTEPDQAPERVLDATGLLAVPGFLDMHVHLRDPGNPESETIATGLAAALAGGFTAVVSMANTRPPNDEPGITRYMLESARRSGSPVRLLPAAAATVRMEGREPADYSSLMEAGASAVSDDGLPVLDDDVMEACVRTAARTGLPILDHATHGPRSARGVMHEGESARSRGWPGLPREEEDALVARDVRIAEAAGLPVHIQHLSTAGGVDAVRRAKARGVPVTAEAAPHHLLLTDEDVRGPEHKMNPPVREPGDREALIGALVDGTVDAVATDHAPHAAELKARGMERAPFGVIGMESAFPALYTGLVVTGRIGLEDLVRLLTEGPARVLRTSGGALTPGEPAEVNLIDLDTTFLFDESCLRSRSRNCPFLGQRLGGRVVATIAGGCVFEHFSVRKRSPRP